MRWVEEDIVMLTREEQGAIIKRIGEFHAVNGLDNGKVHISREEVIELLLNWPTMPEAPGAKPGSSDVKCFDCGAQAHFIVRGKACCYEHYSLHGRQR